MVLKKRLTRQDTYDETLYYRIKENVAVNRQLASQLVVKIFGDIPEPDDQSIIDIVDQLSDPSVARVDVVINSSGGSWNTSVMLYNMLVQMSPYVLVRTIGFGSVYSGAQIIYLAGTERVAAEGTNFLFHSSLVELGYDQSINHKDYLEKHINTEKRLMQKILSKFLSKDELQQVFEYNKQLYLSDIEAQERGIVHQVGYIIPWTMEVLQPKKQSISKQKNILTDEEDEDEEE